MIAFEGAFASVKGTNAPPLIIPLVLKLRSDVPMKSSPVPSHIRTFVSGALLWLVTRLSMLI